MMATGSFFQKEKKLTLKAKAVSQLRNAILSGALSPGTRLVEQELSKMMGISRLPVREAIGNLEQAGLVTVLPYKGAFVSSFGKREIHELFAVRRLLETHAMELAMRKDNPGLLEELDPIVESMGCADMNPDYFIEKLDYQFHSAMCRRAQNKVLYDTWEQLTAKTQTLFALIGDYATCADLMRSHRRLCRLIKEGDCNAAAAGLSRHMKIGQQHVLNKLQIPYSEQDLE
ncbi:MAG: GntR family transcriptional regulator [Desulfovibrio sp.]|jgi:DNA-binding GntR family transcriptional regulator|nr:GntR family transcriptional regulator [Desulfovibrio sp.]